MAESGRLGGARLLPLLLTALLLAGCGSSGGGGSYGGSHYLAGYPSYRVGPPYEINGVWYYPRVDYTYDRSGIASWYGKQSGLRYTANGEIFDPNELTAAHTTLPLPSIVEVTNLDNGRALQLRVNDRGPFADGRIIDVSRRAAQLLGFERVGTADVRVTILKEPSIRVAELAMRHLGGATTMLAEATQTAPLATAPVVAAPVVAAAPVIQGNLPPPLPAPVAPSVPPPPAPPAALARVTPSSPPPLPEPERLAAADVPAAPPPAEPQSLAPVDIPGAPWHYLVPPPAPRAPPARPSDIAALSRLSLIGTADAATYRPATRPAPRLPKQAELAAAGRIFVQAGAFGVAGNARRVGSRIAPLGRVEIIAAPHRGGPLYRVRLGPVRTMDDADRLLIGVIGSGFPGARIVVE